MIKHWLITGDTHGRVVERIHNIRRDYPDCGPSETAIIILGDAGINFFLNKTDKKNKANINSLGYQIYCVRGNHEERPQNIETMNCIFDTEVGNFVYMEEEYPNIRYFQDGGIYDIKGYRCLTIGGAYSVDKWYRLQRAAAQGSSFSGWFEDELLIKEEMDNLTKALKDQSVDFVFTHTCPHSIEPTDLFLDCIDQSTVDKSMEYWLEDLSHIFNWKIWCFGHFHADRIEKPRMEQFYYLYDEISSIYNRWYGEKTISKDYKEMYLSPYMRFWTQIEFEEN